MSDHEQLDEASWLARAVAMTCAMDDVAVPLMVKRICRSVAWAKPSLAKQAARDAVTMLNMDAQHEEEALALLRAQDWSAWQPITP